MQKRGQISIFIITGLVLVMVVFFILFTLSRLYEAPANQVDVPLEKQALSLFVQQCIRSSVHPLVEERMQSGFFETSSLYVQQNKSISIWSSNQQFDVLSFRSFNEDVQNATTVALRSCVEQYATISDVSLTGSVTVTPTITDRSLLLDVSFSLEQQDAVTAEKLSQIIVDIPVRLGYLLSIASHMSSGYTAHLPVDVNMLRAAHPDIQFSVSRPYPYVVVTLEDTSVMPSSMLQFAIEQQDTVFISPSTVSGCCTIDSMCVKGISSLTCAESGGIFSQGEACVCNDPVKRTLEIFSYSSLSAGANCGIALQHGDAQCGFVSGTGGRFFVQSCFDGELINEPCADYRQEVCVQESKEGSTTAYCRQNQGAVCSSCTDEICCLSHDDCSWDLQQCTPKIEPGSPFWTSAGASLCQSSSTETFCPNCTAEESLIRELRQCNSYGDCGSSVSVYGDLRINHFSSYGVVTPSLVEQEAVRTYEFAQTLTPDLLPSDQSVYSFDDQQTQFISPLSQSLRLLQQAYLTSPEEYLSPSNAFSYASQDAFSQTCLPYTAPDTGACSYCEQLPFGCSEYACRSLGSDCLYTESDNSCTTFTGAVGQNTISSLVVQKNLDDSVISFTEQLVANTSIFTTERFDVFGSTLLLQWDTATQSQCHLSHLVPDSSIRTFSQTANGYTHTALVQLPYDSSALEKLPFWFGHTSFVHSFEDVQFFLLRLLQLHTQFPFIEKFGVGIYPLLSPFTTSLSLLDDELSQHILISLDDAMYPLWISCYAGDSQTTSGLLLATTSSCISDPNVVVESHTPEMLRVSSNYPVSCALDSRQVAFSDMRLSLTCGEQTATGDGLTYTCQYERPPEVAYLSCVPTVTLPSRNYTLVVFEQNETSSLVERIPLRQSMTLPIFDNSSSSSAYLVASEPLWCSSETLNVWCSPSGCTVTQPSAGEHTLTCQPFAEASTCSQTYADFTTYLTEYGAINTSQRVDDPYFDAATQTIRIDGLSSFSSCQYTLDGTLVSPLREGVISIAFPGIYTVGISCIDDSSAKYEDVWRVSVPFI